jgi:hypothetical protein
MMPLSKYIKIGAGLGLAGGFVAASYSLGLSTKPTKSLSEADNYGQLAFDCLENLSIAFAPVLAVMSLSLGPVIGGATGATTYLANKSLRQLYNSSRPVQLTVAITAASLIFGKISYGKGRE